MNDMNGNGIVRVVVADDNPVIRAGLESVLHASGRVQVCGHASDGIGALDLAEHERPDVVLLDVRMPRADGLSVVRPLSLITRVLMLTNSADDEVVLSALRLGAAGYLVYGTFEGRDLVDAVVGTAAGDVHLSPTVASAVVLAARRADRDVHAPAGGGLSAAGTPPRAGLGGGGAQPQPGRPARPGRGPTDVDPLSEREREIMEQIAGGRSNSEIAADFFLSEKTVKNHINRIYAKLQVTNRGQAMARWLGVESHAPPRGRPTRDRGQASIAMVFLATVILAGGVLLFQYSRAADLGSRARTAGDAAALAAAGDIRDQMEELLALGIPPQAAVLLLEDSRDAAVDYAAANDGVLIDYAQNRLTVRVGVETQARLDARPIVDTGNQPGVSTAEAAVVLGAECDILPALPEPPPPVPTPVPPPPGSVLRCDGEDVLIWDDTGFVDLRPFIPLHVRLID